MPGSAIFWAGVYVATAATIAGVIWWMASRSPIIPEPDPAFVRAPDPAPVDEALEEDDEVADLDALWELPARDPRLTW